MRWSWNFQGRSPRKPHCGETKIGKATTRIGNLLDFVGATSGPATSEIRETHRNEGALPMLCRVSFRRNGFCTQFHSHVWASLPATRITPIGATTADARKFFVHSETHVAYHLAALMVCRTNSLIRSIPIAPAAMRGVPRRERTSGRDRDARMT